MKTEQQNYITQGPLLPSFIRYFIPILLGALLQQSYSLMDALIIGNFAGASALAAIDAPYVSIKLLINTFLALSSGSAIVIAQQYGGSEQDKVTKTVNVIILFALVGGFLITGAGILFAENFVDMMLIPPDIRQMSLTYLRIYFGGTLFVFVYNMASGSLRALGDSKGPFYYLTISSILNILLDVVFVALLQMGVGGAALATVISQGFSAILVVIRMRKRFGFFHFTHFPLKASFQHLSRSLSLGLPMAVQAILFSIANLYMQRGINSFGTAPIAGWSICGKADFLVWTLSETLGLTLCTFVAQNYGAKNPDRMHYSLLHALWLGILTLGIISLMLFIWIEPVATLFTRDPASISHGITIMKIIAPFYVFYALGEIFAGALKGRGQTFAPMVITLVGTCLFRVAWIKVQMPKQAPFLTIMAGYPLSWLITAVLMTVFYLWYTRTTVYSYKEG